MKESDDNEIRHLDGPIELVITKREYFAIMALQGLLSNGWSKPEYRVEAAINYADSLINGLKNGRQ